MCIQCVNCIDCEANPNETKYCPHTCIQKKEPYPCDDCINCVDCDANPEMAIHCPKEKKKEDEKDVTGGPVVCMACVNCVDCDANPEMAIHCPSTCMWKKPTDKKEDEKKEDEKDVAGGPVVYMDCVDCNVKNTTKTITTKKTVKRTSTIKITTKIISSSMTNEEETILCPACFRCMDCSDKPLLAKHFPTVCNV
ncbi:hypothetical protein PIROE2DRAFT_7632 [Piromyces sp. E2]|nr:hypothetical protein PIROE2DRAFT_7632 [Piromyces sp. E2]|eukprot:OUM65335.1 hypothetical protein PIROE2DRAFT_7632 [Piromyces sp. E2]